MAKVAVVLFNLGGPDGPESVRPFLFNLFNDPAILRLPGFVRRPLAWLISTRRAPTARGIYAHLGGGSPLLANTEAQAAALEAALSDLGAVRVFICMRYWHPMSDEAVAEVKAFAPDAVVLLPLYPQYSTTTTGSSLADWRRAARRAGLEAPTRTVCCYPDEAGFVEAMRELTLRGVEEAAEAGRPRVLFSAHGLPKRVVEDGDPYQWQVERSAGAVVRALDIAELDWVVCYQSRVGPLAWIGPATDAEIERAAADGVNAVVVPIAFVSEHSETLVELDVEYAHLAHGKGMARFVRVSTAGTSPPFIAGLADLVRRALGRHEAVASAAGGRLCPAAWRRCACAGGPCGAR